ncbi:gas vesicle protein K [Streptomyces sp. ISL-94]|uniref:gas vesicle protein K n=1 Tax=Streptomyces sp. ISL-94 TaxID=2819190 RepID=UPI001BE96B3F|nr:gas vesicle protein K [Streptomyces sp. ISL-94]MBT2482377.1 gas vesicle protein K [Streptomyces sp. ISL-94]
MNADPDPQPPPAPDLDALSDTMANAFRLLQAPPTSPGEAQPPARRIHTDPDRVGEDLLKLVLTLVELLRQLIERQALRRVDAGDLTDEQEEELGATLLALHDRMTDLCAEHGYTLQDLNLDLGPLGPLLPPAP